MRDTIKKTVDVYAKSVNGLKHIPKKWAQWTVCNNTNCYAYALNLSKNPITQNPFRDWSHVQPGSLCNRKKFIDWNSVLFGHDAKGIERFVKEFREDCKYINYEVRKSSLKECRKGEWWKVVLYFEKGDYHWYRQNDDRTWSHKVGSNSVKRTDHSGKIITNPEICNRGDYNKLISYFLIRKKVN